MKKSLFLLLLFLPFFGKSQLCNLDSVTNVHYTSVGYTTATVTGTPGDVVNVTWAVKYVRSGQTDTATTSYTASITKNLTGLQSGTLYKYYYITFCPLSGQSSPNLSYYSFTTTSSAVAYTPMTAAGYQFKYQKSDSGMAMPFRDTSIGRGTIRPGPMVLNSQDSLPYFYNGVYWKPFFLDSAGFQAQINLKVDSVTVAGDSLFYWVNGTGYGQVITGLSASTMQEVFNTESGTAVLTQNNTMDGLGYDLHIISDTIQFTGDVYLNDGFTYAHGSPGVGKVLTSDANGLGSWETPAAGTTSISSLTAATTTNDIDNASNQQTWRWNGLFQYGLSLGSVSTAAINGSSLFSSEMSGANAAAGRTTNSGLFQNTHTGSSSTNNGIRTIAAGGTFNRGVDASVSGAATSNYAYYASASGGTNNYGLYVSGGDVNLQPLTASQFLTLDANKNMTSSAVASSILAASITDETGTDKAVFNTSPSFVTSVIGGASMDIFNTVTTTANLLKAATTVNMMASAGVLNFGGGATAAELRFLEPSGSGTNYTGFKSPATLAANLMYTLPTAFVAGGVLTDAAGNGTLSWASAGGMAIGGSITSATEGSVLFAGASGVLAQDNSNLFWDNTNKRLAIGSTTTTFDIDVRKTTDGSVGFGVQNASGGTSAAAVFQLGRSYGADYYVSHYYAGDGNTIYTPLSYNIINASGSTGGMNLVNIANASMTFGTSNTTRMTISGAGAVRMHTYGAGAATFDASGNITSVSDIRLKNKQGNYSGGLKELMKINPIIYKWKPESGMETKHDYIGFSAQNIRSSLGEDAIGINKQGYLSIQDRAILAVAINAIQELKELNDKQQKEIDNLKQIIKNK